MTDRPITIGHQLKWNESEKKIKIVQLGEDKGLSSKFIHAYILPGVWRTCVINADRRSISNLPQNFSSAGSQIREAVSSIAHLKTQWDIDTTATWPRNRETKTPSKRRVTVFGECHFSWTRESHVANFGWFVAFESIKLFRIKIN